MVWRYYKTISWWDWKLEKHLIWKAIINSLRYYNNSECMYQRNSEVDIGSMFWMRIIVGIGTSYPSKLLSIVIIFN